MNVNLSKTNIKGVEEIRLTISPSDNLEREFFNALFTNNNVKIEAIPNSDEIVLKKLFVSENKIVNTKTETE